MAYARVDLPDPLGPMIACVSPDRTVRSTPFRIGFWPSSVMTATCRLVISSVAMSAFPIDVVVDVVRVVDVDEDVSRVDAAGVDRDRLGGRQTRGLAGAEVEPRAVQPAFDLATVGVHVTFAQGDRGVRALVADGEDFVSRAHESDLDAVDLDRQHA